MTMIISIPFSVLLIITTTATAFSPLSTFYDIDVSTTASFFSGAAFGPGCSRGGSIPDGFIAVAMNGATMGMKAPEDICGMCVAIKGPAPTSPDPMLNEGVLGEYYGYVYEVCESCTPRAGLQLGIPGQGQSQVVWRAIPCPPPAPSSLANQPFLYFHGATEARPRFQVRGLSSPIISATVNGQQLSKDGSFYVVSSSSPVFPFDLRITTALDEQLVIHVPAYREHGALTDLISVSRSSPARSTSMTAPSADSAYGSGSITTEAGDQTRTVKTTSQRGRQVLTITTSPDLQLQQSLGSAIPAITMMGGDDDLGAPIGLGDLAVDIGRYEQMEVQPELMQRGVMM